MGDDTTADTIAALLSVLPSGFEADEFRHTSILRPSSCPGWTDAGYNANGVYTIYPGIVTGDETNQYSVYCDQTTDGGGWMLTYAYVRSSGPTRRLRVESVVVFGCADAARTCSRWWEAALSKTQV